MEKEEKHVFLDDGRFIVFEDGRVYKRIDPPVTKTGYQYVAVGKRTYPIHRLVAENFVPNPENKPEVNHIDGDKTNNNVSNLEWVTRSENVQHAISHGLFRKTAGHDKPKVKTPIWYCRKATGMTQNELAEKLGVNASTISLWENGKLAPLWNAVIPPIVSLILPPILRSAPHVPVYHDGRAATTMKESLRLLQSGKNLVIFPEIPTGFGEHDPEKINEGWLRMLPMYEKRAGKSLKIRPVRLDLAEKRMMIRAPFGMNPDVPLRDQVPELSRKVLQGIFESEERKENT